MKSNITKISNPENLVLESVEFKTEPDLLGWIIYDSETGLYDWHNRNDLGNADLEGYGPISAQKVYIIDNNLNQTKKFKTPYIYIFDGKEFGIDKDNLITKQQAIKEILNCWSIETDKIVNISKTRN